MQISVNTDLDAIAVSTLLSPIHIFKSVRDALIPTHLLTTYTTSHLSFFFTQKSKNHLHAHLLRLDSVGGKIIYNYTRTLRARKNLAQ